VRAEQVGEAPDEAAGEADQAATRPAEQTGDRAAWHGGRPATVLASSHLRVTGRMAGLTARMSEAVGIRPGVGIGG
jgi:hypothetical protein